MTKHLWSKCTAGALYFAKVEYMKKYNDWCTNPVFDEETKTATIVGGNPEYCVIEEYYNYRSKATIKVKSKEKVMRKRNK